MKLAAVFLTVLQTLALAFRVSTADTHIHYVRATDTPLSDCSGQPCLSLDQYTESNNLTTGTTLLFLPGNHSLQQSILNLTSVSNVSLRGEEGAYVLCTNSITILCENVTGFSIEGIVFLLTHEDLPGSALTLSNSDAVITSATFQGSRERSIRPILINHSEVTIQGCTFVNNKGLSSKDGAVSALAGTNLTITGSFFSRNTIAVSALAGTNLTITGSSFSENLGYYGGAISVHESAFLLQNTSFTDNFAVERGGAIDCLDCRLEMTGSNTFEDNFSRNMGGALTVYHGTLIISDDAEFTRNKALDRGGAIVIEESKAFFRGSVFFAENLAREGGGMNVKETLVIVHTEHMNFTNNTATYGGALHITGSNVTFSGDTRTASQLSFTRNTAHDTGGALYARQLSFTRNAGRVRSGALYAYQNSITFSVSTRIAHNRAKHGGGIDARNSKIMFRNSTAIDSNSASSNGGALNCVYGTVTFQGPTLLTQNRADEDGGALYALGTTIYIQDKVNFMLNSAQNGGAVYLEAEAALRLPADTDLPTLLFSRNSALEYGGVIFHQDSPTTSQCHNQQIIRLPDCFLQQLPSSSYSLYGDFPPILSYNNSAGLAGSFLYGGLLDRCRYVISDTSTYIDLSAIAKIEGEVTSKPYRLCFCYLRCGMPLNVQVYRGQSFTVSLLASAQEGDTYTTITAVTSPKARLETYQTSQPLPDDCHPLPYTLYSTDSHEEVVLYPDGPCRDTGTARAVINVTLLPCPDGFTQSGEHCICEERLHHYHVNCTIDDDPYFTKTADSKFWMSALYTNMTYEGLMLAKSCPVEYCKTDAVNITLDDTDFQCDLNRSGLLCGACATNHSLMLGSSQCQVCPNTYLALLLPFAAAGVALVVFLSFLRLTVATGTLNSVILYANIVQVNKRLFFPANTRNVLTVFLAWMNLDLGFQTCFYDGMDAYAQTWLQFAFPLYVWLLIALMIFVSRYSITVSKLIGTNPIAVLATLTLMSYTKILKIIIEVYSSTDLDYSDNETVTVWLKDANVPYLESKHLLLTVVTSLILIFLFLPYTLLLLLGHKLYWFMGRKHWRWLNRLKPLLDSYYAPYKMHTRYWTGFLLLVRCVLYIIFLLYSRSASKSLLATVLTFTAIGFTVGVCRIYKKLYINLLEVYIYLNLIVLSATTLTGLNPAPLVYSLVGLVLVVTISLSAHHFHQNYIVKTTSWQRLRRRWPLCRKKPYPNPDCDESQRVETSLDRYKLATRTVIELRESLLEN